MLVHVCACQCILGAYSLPTVHNEAQSVQAVWQSADIMEAAWPPGYTSLAVNASVLAWHVLH
jgi:hypothetical protein